MSSQHPSRFRPNCNDRAQEDEKGGNQLTTPFEVSTQLQQGCPHAIRVQHECQGCYVACSLDQSSRPGFITMSALEPCRPNERALTHPLIFSVLTGVAGGRLSAV
jgi:hypothetical protein